MSRTPDVCRSTLAGKRLGGRPPYPYGCCPAERLDFGKPDKGLPALDAAERRTSRIAADPGQPNRPQGAWISTFALRRNGAWTAAHHLAVSAVRWPVLRGWRPCRLVLLVRVRASKHRRARRLSPTVGQWSRVVALVLVPVGLTPMRRTLSGPRRPGRGRSRHHYAPAPPAGGQQTRGSRLPAALLHRGPAAPSSPRTPRQLTSPQRCRPR